MTYRRVIPRDLFNEANLLKCYARIYINLETAGLHGVELQHDGLAFVVEQDPSNGAMFVSNVKLTASGPAGRTEHKLQRPLNSRDAWPLMLVDDQDEETPVFTADGSFSEDFIDAMKAEIAKLSMRTSVIPCSSQKPGMNVQGRPAVPPYYIWAQEDCANMSHDFSEAKRIRAELVADGLAQVYIVDADGVEVVDPEIEAAEAREIRADIGLLIDYAEKFAELNIEPAGGDCWAAINSAQLWFESGAWSVDALQVRNALVEYVQRFADLNNEPEDGACRKLLWRVRDEEAEQARERQAG